MSEFISYYWQPADLPDAETAAAFHTLIAEPGDPQAQQAAFRILLESTSPVSQGIASDHFFYRNSLERFGANNPFEPYAPQLLASAREQLKGPPVASVSPGGKS